MILATRLSAVWQVAGVAGAALCCYLVSQTVASERAGLAKTDREIAEARQDIARLQTEIGVRGRMSQLEAWNQTFGLHAPRPAQFVSDGVQLASLYGHGTRPQLPLNPAITSQQAVDKVSYQKPADAATPTPVVAEAVSAQPILRPATYVRPAPDRMAPSPDAPLVERTALHADVDADATPAPKPIKLKKQAAKPGSQSLLPDDIGLIAAQEVKGAKGKALR
jgi:hypothetical protein